MSLFDSLLGNLNIGDIAGKLGLSEDQVQTLMAKVTEGDLNGLIAAAQEQGVDLGKVQEMLGGLGGSPADMMSKASELLGGNAGDGLGDMLGGLLGKK